MSPDAAGAPETVLPRSGTAKTTSSFDTTVAPLTGSLLSSDKVRWPGARAVSGKNTNSPRESVVTVPMDFSPSRTVTSAFGAARPAMTVSPLSSTRTTSKLGGIGWSASATGAAGVLATGEVVTGAAGAGAVAGATTAGATAAGAAATVSVAGVVVGAVGAVVGACRTLVAVAWGAGATTAGASAAAVAGGDATGTGGAATGAGAWAVTSGSEGRCNRLSPMATAISTRPKMPITIARFTAQLVVVVS